MNPYPHRQKLACFDRNQNSRFYRLAALAPISSPPEIQYTEALRRPSFHFFSTALPDVSRPIKH
jgi:hypothetical protein